jgi:hypothetical protein
MIHEESSWVSEISATGSIWGRRQQIYICGCLNQIQSSRHIETKGGNHKQLKKWEADHGAQEVEL